MTTGTCVVTSFMARAAGGPSVTITSVDMPASSAASAGKRVKVAASRTKFVGDTRIGIAEASHLLMKRRTEYAVRFEIRDARTGTIISAGNSGLRMGADYSWSRGAVRLIKDRSWSARANSSGLSPARPWQPAFYSPGGDSIAHARGHLLDAHQARALSSRRSWVLNDRACRLHGHRRGRFDHGAGGFLWTSLPHR
jgi:hypothetical protein